MTSCNIKEHLLHLQPFFLAIFVCYTTYFDQSKRQNNLQFHRTLENG